MAVQGRIFFLIIVFTGLLTGGLIAAALFSDNSNRVTASTGAVGAVVGESDPHTSAVVLLFVCCVIQRRGVQRVTATRPYIPPPLPLHRHPHNNGSLAVPNPYLINNPESEYPSANAADFAPPPYVKEGTPTGMDVPSADLPPPGIDAAYSPVYSPPPGPPPPAHISPTADFNGGFRPLAP